MIIQVYEGLQAQTAKATNGQKNSSAEESTHTL